nr:hypothetical protein [Melioribacteraceae bacterium]
MRYFTLLLVFVFCFNTFAQDAKGRSPKLKLTDKKEVKQIEQTTQTEVVNNKPFIDDLLTNIPKATTIKNNAVAVIIGNKDYVSAPNVDFAVNDARAIKEYVINAFGYKPENIIYVENAKQSDFYSIFGKE